MFCQRLPAEAAVVSSLKPLLAHGSGHLGPLEAQLAYGLQQDLVLLLAE